MPLAATITGVILAGGKSRRMGQNKALMYLGEQRLIDRVAQVMRVVCDDILLVTNIPAVYADLGLPMVQDILPEKGALGGIYSALYHAAPASCLVVACDMPFLQASVLRYLMAQARDYDVVVPDIHGEYQPLHALYRQTCAAPIWQRMTSNRLKITDFFPEVRVRTVTARELQPFDPDLLVFQNINTPEDFQRALQQWQRS